MNVNDITDGMPVWFRPVTDGPEHRGLVFGAPAATSSGDWVVRVKDIWPFYPGGNGESIIHVRVNILKPSPMSAIDANAEPALRPLVIKPSGYFTDYKRWVHGASRVLDDRAICWDTAGNVLRNGGDFMTARDTGRFPVAFGWPGLDPDEPKPSKPYFRRL